jgi:hypothetical protein
MNHPWPCSAVTTTLNCSWYYWVRPEHDSEWILLWDASMDSWDIFKFVIFLQTHFWLLTTNCWWAHFFDHTYNFFSKKGTGAPSQGLLVARSDVSQRRGPDTQVVKMTTGLWHMQTFDWDPWQMQTFDWDSESALDTCNLWLGLRVSPWHWTYKPWYIPR